jgi:hypothetical protein
MMPHLTPINAILATFSEQNTIIFREQLTQTLTNNINQITDKRELGTLLGEYTARYENTQLNLFSINQDVFERYISALGYVGYPGDDIYLPFVNAYLEHTTANPKQFQWILYLALRRQSPDLYNKILHTPTVTTYDVISNLETFFEILISGSTPTPNSFLNTITMVLDNIDILTISEIEQYKILYCINYSNNIHIEDKIKVLTTLLEKGFSPNVKNSEGFPLWFDLFTKSSRFSDPDTLQLITFYTKQNIDLFTPVPSSLTNNTEPIPAIFHLVDRCAAQTSLLDLLIEPIQKLSPELLYSKDSWGRNLLHIHLIAIKQEVQEQIQPSRYYIDTVILTTFTNFLLEIGFNLNEPIKIDDEGKVTLAKIKGTLPKEYGKTGRQIVAECYNMIKKK